MKNKTFRTFGHLFIALILTGSVFAQIDTNFIYRYNPLRHDGAIITTLQRTQISFRGSEETGLFENYSLGVGIRYRWRGVGLALELPVATINPIPEGEGNPRATTLALQLFPGQWYVRAEGTRLTGFNFQDESRADDRMLFTRINALYLLNAKKFSGRAAMNLVNRQERSAGTWVLQGIGGYLRYRTEDGLALPLPNRPDFTLRTYDHAHVGVGGGYGYNLIFKRFSFANVATAWAEVRFFDFADQAGGGDGIQTIMRPRLQTVSTLSWQPRDTYYGLIFRWRPPSTAPVEPIARYQNWWLRLLVGRRF